MPENGFGESKSVDGEDESKRTIEEDTVGVIEVVEIIDTVGVIGLVRVGFRVKVKGLLLFLKLYNFMNSVDSVLGMVHVSSMKIALVKVEAF